MAVHELWVVWSPDGKFLAVVHEPENDLERRGIYSLSVETGRKRRLTWAPPAAVWDWHPSFSPDGDRLAFLRRDGQGHIYLLDLTDDGGPDGEPRRISFDRNGAGGLDWIPGSSSIVFSSLSGGSYSLWQVSVSGGEPERLATADNATSPSISRRGNRLVYERSQFDGNIWRVPGLGFEAVAVARGQRKATQFIASTRHDHSPHFSPDGSKIVFLSERSGTQQVWVADADGMNPVQVTSSLEEMDPGSPRWSPDGRWIAFDLSEEGRTVHIHVVSAAGGAPRQLTTGAYRDTRPAWSQDGRRVYFGSERSGDWQVWKVPFEGGEPEQVTRGGGREAMESPDGAFVYYTKLPPTRGIWRVPVGGGEEEQVLEQGFQGRWEIAEEGIYLVQGETRPGPAIEFFSLVAKSVETVASLVEDTRFRGHQFTVSPDGRWVLYGRTDNVQSDIMLLEGFE